MAVSIALGTGLLRRAVAESEAVVAQSTQSAQLPFLVAGIVVLVVVVVDLLWTTLWVDGGSGPLSARLTTWTWRGLRRVGSHRSRALSLAGPLILVLTLATWVGLIWGGWTLVFAGNESALVDTQGDGPISWVDRLYFVAYSMFTMGNGDFSPADGLPQIATSFTTATGMLFVTLGVSYVLSVLGAVVDKRSFATNVTGMGERSEAFVRAGWDDEDLRGLDIPLNSLASNLSRLAVQHKAYPILHYYHSEEGVESSAMAVAVFDEALTLLRHGVEEKQRPNEAIVMSARSSTRSYLETLNAAFIEPADREPPPPDLDRLRDAGLPTVSDEAFGRSLDDLAERRRKLLAVVRADAWHWPPIDDE